jgi:hypothetical protein
MIISLFFFLLFCLHLSYQVGWPEGKRRVAVTEVLAQLNPLSGVSEPMRDYLTAKFILQRFKSLCRRSRWSVEDAVAAQLRVAAKQMEARQHLKKCVVQMLKLIQRNGYPRSSYTAVEEAIVHMVDDDDERTSRLSYLYSWGNLANESNLQDSDINVKDLVHSAVLAFNEIESKGVSENEVSQEYCLAL